jgi:hypothetical protein
MNALSLTHTEAVELLPVLVARTAEGCGARALLIKGQAADFHGLRAPQLSADVDVLIEPSGIDAVLQALTNSGWSGLADDVLAQPDIVAVKHSVTLRHPLWPIELDLHRHFPGMFAPAPDAFAALWDDRTSLPLAGQQVDATGFAGSVVIGILHAWRNPGRLKTDTEIAAITAVLNSTTQDVRDSVSAMAARTGTAEAGRERWLAVGIDPGPTVEADPDDLLAWRIQTDTTGQPLALGWIFELRRQPLHRRPGVLLRALLGANEYHLRTRYPTAPPGPRGLWIIRWWRLKAAVKDAPRIVSLLRRHRGH